MLKFVNNHVTCILALVHIHMYVYQPYVVNAAA